MISLSRILAGLSEREAKAVYHALSQWADNERNGLEESEPMNESEVLERARFEEQVALVEGVVGKLDEEFVKLAETG